MPDIVPPAPSTLPKIVPPSSLRTEPVSSVPSPASSEPPASWKAGHAKQAPMPPPQPAGRASVAPPPVVPPSVPVVSPPGGPLVPPSAANPTVVRPKPRGGALPARPVQAVVTPESGQPRGAAPTPTTNPAPVLDSEPADIELPDLSDTAIAFMSSQRYRDSDEGLARDFDLTPDDLSFLNEMDHFVLGGTIKLDGYVRALRQEFPAIPADKRDELIARLLAERFVPWDTALKPTAQEVARTANLRLPGVPYYAVYSKPLTYGGAAGEVARMADIPVAGQTRERLRDLVMSRAKGIRVDAQVIDQLTRPADMGGLGLAPEKAQIAVQAIGDILARAKLMTEEEYSRWLSNGLGTKGSKDPSASLGAGSRTKGDKQNEQEKKEEDEDEKEIQAIAAKMPKPLKDTSSVLALSTQTLLNRLTGKPTDPYLAKRLEDLVSTRLRDVRSRQEVVAKLMRDVKVGGIGLDRSNAERLANEIEEGYAEFHGLIAQEEKEKMDVLATQQAQKVEERKKREQEEHARWFKEKIQRQQAEEEMKRQTFERFRLAAQGLTNPVTNPHPVDVKERAREKEQLGELVPTGEGTGRGALGVGTQNQTGTLPDRPFLSRADLSSPRIETATPAPDAPRPTPSPSLPTIAPPAPRQAPVVRVSAATADAAKQDAAVLRPRMDDVRVFQTRLSGPLQELEGLTLASFRRLGKTPQEAIARVEEKIELLGQESFERRLQGIQAWQNNPLQKAYLELVTSAFASGSPVSTVAMQKRTAGEDVPSPEEITAIVELNGKLHF